MRILYSLSQITLHAMQAAIPHATLILFGLLDILPFPKDFVTYTIKTGTATCSDEPITGGFVGSSANVGEDGDGDWIPELFDEEKETMTRHTVSACP